MTFSTEIISKIKAKNLIQKDSKSKHMPTLAYTYQG